MRYLIVACLCAALAGCTETIYLRNMAGMVATCGPYKAVGIETIANADREANCVRDYQRQGYERTPNPGR